MPISYPLPTIAGLVASHDGVDFPVASFPTGGTVERFYATVTDPSSAAPIDLQIRNPGGAFIPLTIPAGQASAEASGTLVFAAGETATLRVIAGADSLNLSGFVELPDTGAGPVLGPAFTTLPKVKAHAGITSPQFDAFLETLIQSVSEAMRSYMGREITEQLVTDETHSVEAWEQDLYLRDYPVQSISSVTERGDLVDPSGYSLDAKTGRLTRLDAEFSASEWARGHHSVVVTYLAGYDTVPFDLELAATEETRHRFHQSVPGGRDALGMTSKALDTGGQSVYVPGSFLPFTLQVMQPYRRLGL